MNFRSAVVTTAHDKKSTRPTMRLIAERAGVSRATVSLILTNRDEVLSRFRPDTVERVRQIAKDVGYQANLAAISLRGAHPSFFALILRGTPHADAISWHHQAFEGQLLAGALDASREDKLYPLLAVQDSPDPQGALEQVEEVLEGGVFGAIIRTPLEGMEESIHRQIERGLPVVVCFPGNASQYPTNVIDVDNTEAGGMAIKLLHDSGSRRIALVRGENAWEAVLVREEGARRTAERLGLELELIVTPSDLPETELTKRLMPPLREMQPDGVYAASSVSGVGALLACQAVGLSVPDKTRLVGCDASLWQAPGCPSITSVDLSWYAAGQMAVRKMVELQEQGKSVFENVILPPLIRQGDSCPAPGDYQAPSVTVTS